jgi:hypothetical protein
MSQYVEVTEKQPDGRECSPMGQQTTMATMVPINPKVGPTILHLHIGIASVCFVMEGELRLWRLQIAVCGTYTASEVVQNHQTTRALPENFQTGKAED